MTPNNTPRDVQGAVIKWGITMLGALVIAGAISLANRNVYSKPEVDTKLQHEREISDIGDRAIKDLIHQQNESINTQLQLIRSDQTEIKTIIKENRRGN